MPILSVIQLRQQLQNNQKKYYNIYTLFSAFPCYTFSEIILFYCTKNSNLTPEVGVCNT